MIKLHCFFSSANKPGALQEMLACFSSSGVNMTRIESRPSRKGMWEYIFFVDVEGHVQEAKVALALSKLEESTHHGQAAGIISSCRFMMIGACEPIKLATPEVAALQPYQPGKSITAISNESSTG